MNTVSGEPKPSQAEPLGVSLTATGINVAVFAQGAQGVEICFFDESGAHETHRITLSQRLGAVFYEHIEGRYEGAKYGFRVYGPFDPSQGLRFNPNRLLVDPYAQELDRPFVLHESQFDSAYDTDSAPLVPKSIVCAPLDPIPSKPNVTWDDTIIYELHVRGFTKLMPEVPEAIRGTFAGLGHPAAIAYLKGLGITAVELLPCTAWSDDRHLLGTGLGNYWGYNPIAFCAPDPRLAPGGWTEVRDSIAALAQAGIETIVDVVFNHSGEGDELGPTLCLKGFSNEAYYRLNPDDPSTYINDAGTGNILNCDHPAVIHLIMESLRTWAKAGVAGFRFDLATTLGRRKDGFDPHAPLLAAIAQDPVLRRLKLIAEPWDCGPGGHQLGQFPANWAEWNDRYRDVMRAFWRGDGVSFGDFARRLCGSEDIFHGRRPSASLNFINAHDGFTLADLTTYNIKNNYANGEGNRDGTNDNISSNHGHEGPCDDPNIIQARLKTQYNLLASLLLSRGTPMLSMGAELGKSQGGNNNAFTQDNALSWIEWDKCTPGLLEVTKRLIALRRAHPALHQDRFLSGDTLEPPYQDVTWYNGDGGAMSAYDWDSPHSETLVANLNAQTEVGLDRIIIIFHRGQSARDIVLPWPRDGHAWQVNLDTDDTNRIESVVDDRLRVAANSITILDEKIDPEAAVHPASSEAINALSGAVGIEPTWHSLDGTYTEVTQATKIAILRGMGFDVSSQGAAWRAVHDYAEHYQYRPTPHYQCADEGDVIRLVLITPPTQIALNTRLYIEDEAAAITTHDLRHSFGHPYRGADGHIVHAHDITLPALPMGRYRVWREDAPEFICALTVAPKCAYLPDDLKPSLGLSAQLYGVRRDDDQGIGDFTTLKSMLDHAKTHAVGVVAINPLHVLFRHKIGRASPYYPSDRRFFNPLYLDLPEAISDDGGDSIDYESVWAKKSAALKARFEAAKTDPDFRNYVETASPALLDFATYEALSAHFDHVPWQSWPKPYATRDPSTLKAFLDAHREAIDYFLYEQYLCEQQLRAATSDHGLSIGLCRDLAVGAAPDGAESWAMQDIMARDISIGAPPDPLGPQGQVWGLPPLSPHGLIKDQLKTVADMYRRNMAHAGALRIDHAMGLMRQFWVPEGMKGAAGAYVRFPFHALLAELKLESLRHKCVLIGEDLGTVPDGFRHTMSSAKILSYRVMPFERYGEAFIIPDHYPPLSLACVATHDLPPLAGWWHGVEIKERHAIGLYTDDEAQRELAGRARDKEILVETLRTEGLFDGEVDLGADLSESLLVAIHAYIAKSKALLAVVQIEDLGRQTRSVNLPGTDMERPNWRYRIDQSLDAIFASALSQAVLQPRS